MNHWQIAIQRSIERLRDHNFTRQLNPSEGGILYDYLCQKLGVDVLEVNKEDKDRIWTRVFNDYVNNYSASHPVLFCDNINFPLGKNKTVIATYKAELARFYLKNNKEVWESLNQ